MSTEQQIAYAAGFFDGEGTIGIYFSQNSYKFQMRAYQIEERREPIMLLQRLFGGSVYTSEKSGGRRRQLTWRVNGQLARRALAAMYPYLLVKKHQAFMGLVYLHSRDMEDARAVAKACTGVIKFLNGSHEPLKFEAPSFGTSIIN